ncbi:MAG: PAS domain S-box protein [Myxococcales bacterium]|nr:PAS domain S-box protein [Myxococcales bacterium]
MKSRGTHDPDEVAQLRRRVAELEDELASLRETSHPPSYSHPAERRLAMLTETLPIGIGVTTHDGVILYANQAGADQHGVALDDLVGSRAQNLFEDPADRERLLSLLQAHGRVDNFETWWRKPDGSRRRMSLTSQPIAVDGQTCIMGTGIDITAQYEAQQRMRAIAEAGPVAIIISRRRDNVVVYVNAPMCTLLGAEESQLLGRPGPDFWADREHRDRVMEEVGRSGELRGEELQLVPASGERLWVSADIVALTFQGEPCVMGALVNVDEARRTRTALGESLEQQALLLRELNHRVRNNLQVLSSILHMYRADASGSPAETAFAECSARVHAMGAIHEALVEQPSVAQVSLPSLVHALVSTTLRLHADTRPGVDVSVAGDLTLHLEQAVPCGLLVNELLNHALKLGFPEGTGKIDIRLSLEGDEGRLVVADNGVEVPLRPRLPSLGSKLLAALARQLGGDLQQRASDAGGLHVELSFPLAAPE